LPFRLLCLRHGRTAWNSTGRFQGQSDIPLDAVGRAQAAQTALHLADVPIHYAVASDLARARETAEIVLAGHGIELETDADLRERNFGDWEGLTWQQIVERHPEHADHSVMHARVFEPTGGETFSATTARAAAAFARLCTKVGSQQTALLVAHAGLLHALLDVLFGTGRENWMITPASVMEIEIEHGRARMVARDRFAPANE
jgi:broad specificity phosphatase PhoE